MNYKVSDLLKLLVHRKGSDLFITAGIPPAIKAHGRLFNAGDAALTPADSLELVHGVMNDAQKAEFDRVNECNFAIAFPGVGRFRVSAFRQKGCAGMVIRRIQTRIPRFDELNLPPILARLAMAKRGLVIFVGATGSGKSTSLAAMIGHRNQSGGGHIITIEDPIEYVHQHARCIVTQREVGVDTESFEVALKNTLRQAPDVILIGEIRTRETMDYAIQFAETGHLCLSTLHANNANQALDRIINFFPEERCQQLLMDLSLNLKAIIAQQLIPTADGKGRVPAVEILINTPLASDMIRKGDVHELKGLMKRSAEQGMQTFDQALVALYRAGKITREDAIRHADSENEVRLAIKMVHAAGDPDRLMEATESLSILPASE